MNLPKNLTARFHFDPEKDQIGIGGSALVYKATDTQLERVVAIKMLSSHPERNEANLLTEIRRAVKLEHPNILRYYELKEWDEKNEEGKSETKRAVILEYANGGDLASFIKRDPPLAEKTKIISDLLEGLKYLHSQKVVHVDLKPENIFIQEIEGKVTAKIADFGLSVSLDKPEEISGYLEGSLHYIAPERLNPGKFYDELKFAPPSVEADLWAFGAIIFFIFSGKAPFQETGGKFKSNDVIAYKITEETIPDEVDRLPAPYELMVRRCLIKDPSHRVNTVEKLIRIMHDHNLELERKRRAAHQAETAKNAPLPVKSTMVDDKENSPPEPPPSQDPNWKLKITCSECGEENKVKRIRCLNCANVLRGPMWVRSFHSAGGVGLAIFLVILTGMFILPFVGVYQGCVWVNGKCIIENWQDANPETFSAFQELSIWVEVGLLGFVWLITAILFAKWVNNAHRNLDSLNAKGLKFAHSVGGILFALPIFAPAMTALFVLGTENEELIWLPFVVGILSLMLPFFYMKETWKGSHPELLDSSGVSWRKGKGSLMLFSWWIASLLFPISFLVPYIPGLGLAELTETKLVFSQLAWLVSMGILISAATLTILLVIRINYRQGQRFKNIIHAWEARE